MEDTPLKERPEGQPEEKSGEQSEGQEDNKEQDPDLGLEQRPGQGPRRGPVQGPMRVRLPRGKEIIGEIIELLGASRFRVSCQDSNTRVCRMPGKFRRRMRIRIGNLVIIEPWDIEPKEKGDIVWIYTRTQANWLRARGHVK
jgi:translation initiation factor 1A